MMVNLFVVVVADLEGVQAREQAAGKIRSIVTEAAAVETPNAEQNDGIINRDNVGEELH